MGSVKPESVAPSCFWAHIVVEVVVVLAGLLWYASLPRSPWESIYTRFHSAVLEVHALGRYGEAVGVKSGTAFVATVRPSQRMILTCHHTVSGSVLIAAEFYDGATDSPQLLDASADADLSAFAPRRINLRRYGACRIGDSRSLVIGDEVMTIGHPLGGAEHVTLGLLSGRQRRPEGRVVLRLSMTVDPGNSGGPVFDRHGRVVGIVSAKHRESSNIAFAVPIEDVRGLSLPVPTVQERARHQGPPRRPLPPAEQ